MGSGDVKCWGSNEASSDIPVKVKGLAGVKSLASDQAGYCALLRSGRADCWGDNDYNKRGDGQLGDLAGSGSSTLSLTLW